MITALRKIAQVVAFCCGVTLAMNGRTLSVEEALGMIESGNNDRAVGRAGEISRYQIKKSVWRKHSSSSRFWDRTEAWRVAEKILMQRANDYRRQSRRAPDAFELYVLWNAPGQFRSVGYHKKRVAKVVAERATRFANIVNAPASVTVASRSEESRIKLLLADQSLARVSQIAPVVSGTR